MRHFIKEDFESNLYKILSKPNDQQSFLFENNLGSEQKYCL